MNGKPKPAEDQWFVHRHSLVKEKEVLKKRLTILEIKAEPGFFKAWFELLEDASKTEPIVLHKNLLDGQSYFGAGKGHVTRIIPIVDTALGVRALVGHITRTTGKEEDVQTRDFFIATREKRTSRPPMATPYQFLQPLQIPLYDHKPHGKADVIQLSKHEIFVEGNVYDIELEALSTGGLEFRTIVDKNRRVGGLVLPVAADQSPTHVLLVCCHHLHSKLRHQEAGEMNPLSSIPGHPICTRFFGAYKPL